MTNAMLTEENSIGRMATGANATLVGKALGTGLDFLRLAIMARLLGVEAFGLYAIAWNFLRIVGTAVPPWGYRVASFISPRVSGKEMIFQFRNIILRSLTLTLLMSTAMCLGLFWLAPWLSETVFHDPNLVVTLRIFVWMLPFMAGLRILSSSTRVSQRMSYSILAEDMTPAVANFILFSCFIGLTHEVIGAVFYRFIICIEGSL
ncbi:MAG: oligosaccharide flippase family protein [Chloroflexi bacterium]|nr:oligosaccharide flippase family protein [Chloroflexota bacterium]